MDVMELQSGTRSLKMGCYLQRVSKQCGWSGGKEFTAFTALDSSPLKSSRAV